MSLAIRADALSGASRFINIIEGQDTRSGIIAALIREVNGHAAASPASVLEKLVHQRLDLVESEVAVIALEEGADASAADVAAKGEGSSDGFAHRSSNGHRNRAANADDVFACAVYCAAWQGAGVCAITEELHDTCFPIVLYGGKRTET